MDPSEWELCTLHSMRQCQRCDPANQLKDALARLSTLDAAARDLYLALQLLNECQNDERCGLCRALIRNALATHSALAAKPVKP